MNIVIDCRMIDSSGIGVYLRESLPYLLKTANTFLLLGDKRRLSSYSVNDSVRVFQCNIKAFSLKEILFFPKEIRREINRYDIYFTPYFNIPCGIDIPVFSTIHDIIFPDMPELTSKTGLFLRMYFYKRAARLSKSLFTVSYFSKSRIEHHLGTGKPVIVTYSAIKPFYKTALPEKVHKAKTILFIGNIKKHKGLWLLLDAFRMARGEGLDYRLVIAGERKRFRTSDKTVLDMPDNDDSQTLEFSGAVSDEKLKALLSEASLLVQPSLYEGFGLPPLEAMAMGTAVLVSDIPVFKEIYEGFPVHYFRSGDPEDLKNRILELLYRKEPERIRLKPELLNKYHFEKTAGIIITTFTTFKAASSL
jgi:glycosyltransferase involved in cell wall biosynthesis